MVWLSALFPAPPAEGLALSLTGGSPALPALGHTLVQTGRGLDKSQCRDTPHCVRSEEDVGEILISLLQLLELCPIPPAPLTPAVGIASLLWERVTRPAYGLQ